MRFYLYPDQPFYGLRDPRLGQQKIAFTPIPAIARGQIATVLTQQSHGPYYCGGYSFGCLIAFEIAQQLQKAGHHVGALIFLDLPRTYHPQRPTLSFGAKIRRLLNQHNLSAAYNRIVKTLTRLTKRFTPGLASPLSILEANILAKNAYVPQVYPGRLVFFQTKRNRDISQEWEPFIAGGIEVHEIPGDHYTMWQEPHVQILAEKLKTVLGKLQTDAS